MTRFQTSLDRIDAALTVPQPQRGRVIAELAADLEDLYGTLRADGLSAADAERRALELVLPEGAALRELELLHQPLYRRLSARLSGRARARFERAAVVFLSLGVVGLTAAGLPLGTLLAAPSPFLVPVLALGCAGLVVAMVCALRMFVLGAASPDDGARGLDFVLLFAAAGPFLACTGLLIDLYIALGSIMADPTQTAGVLIRLLRADGTLLVSALCLALLTSLSWLLLHARLAVLREAAAAPGRSTRRIALLESARARDVA
jgi:hypothetical protein